MRAAGLHVAGTLAVPGCLAAGLFELSRARAGNALSWAYALEWPLFAVIVVYVWIRLAREFRAEAAGSPVPAQKVRSQAQDRLDGEDDPQLQAWQHYLAQLHAQDPPGGPPG